MKIKQPQIQVINWFPRIAFKFIKLDPAKTSLAYIYDWCLNFGFWEIRKWSKNTVPGPRGRIVIREQGSK